MGKKPKPKASNKRGKDAPLTEAERALKAFYDSQPEPTVEQVKAWQRQQFRPDGKAGGK